MTSLRVPSLLLACVLLAPLAAAPAAHAQGAAEAEQLFRDGKRLMDEKKYPEACAAFEASYKLDPLATTLLNLANCRELNHQIASAWGHFLEAERLTRTNPADAPLNKTAKDRAAKLEPRLSFLIINVPDESRVEGLAISRNGAAVDPLTWNRALPVDGGDYVIEGKAPGHEAWSTKVTVAPERDKQSVDVPRFKALPMPDPVDPDGGGGGGALGGGGPVDRPGGGMSGKRKLALGFGVAGLAGAVTGVIFELQAQGTYDESTREPDDQRQQDLVDEANGQRTIAIIAGGVGAALIGTAAFLWLTGGGDASAESPDPQAWRITPALGGDTVGLTLTGGF